MWFVLLIIVHFPTTARRLSVFLVVAVAVIILSGKTMENNKRLPEEESRKRQKAETEAEQLRQRVERAERAEEEQRQRAERAEGNYYSTIDQVWVVAANTYYDRRNFDQLKRQTVPQVYSRSADATTQGPNVYNVTINAAHAEDYEAAFSTTRSTHSSNTTNYNDPIFTKDIFGNDKHVGQQLAHLIPHSKDHATLYVDVHAVINSL